MTLGPTNQMFGHTAIPMDSIRDAFDLANEAAYAGLCNMVKCRK